MPSTANAATAMCNVPIETGDGPCCARTSGCPRRTAKVPTVLTVTGYNKDTTNPAGQGARARAGSPPPTRRSPTRATRSCSSTTAAPARARASGTRGASARSSTTRTSSTGSRRSRGRTARSARPAARTWASRRCSSPRRTPCGCRQGKPRAVKAVWADVPMSDAYRDVTFHGGADRLGLHPAVARPDEQPLRAAAVDDARPTRRASAPTWADHLRNAGSSPARRSSARRSARTRRTTATSTACARRATRADQIRVPVALTGGWWDIFQRGEPLLYEQLDQRARQEALHVAALPHGRRPGDWRTPAQGQVVRPLAEGHAQRRRAHPGRELLRDERRPLAALQDVAGAGHRLHAASTSTAPSGSASRSTTGRSRPQAARAATTRAAAARLEPVLAADHAVDGGRRPPGRARPTTARTRRTALTYTTPPLSAHPAHRPDRREPRAPRCRRRTRRSSPCSATWRPTARRPRSPRASCWPASARTTRGARRTARAA